MKLLLNPWAWLAFLAWTAAVAGGTWFKATHHCELAHQAAQLDAERRRAERIAGTIAAAERRRAARAALNRSLDEEVTRYVATDSARADCVDADGLRLLQAISRGAVPDVPTGAVPAGHARTAERQPR